jgi:hypothetical protein
VTQQPVYFKLIHAHLERRLGGQQEPGHHRASCN